MRLSVTDFRQRVRESMAAATKEPVEIVNSKRRDQPVEAVLLDAGTWNAIKDYAVVRRQLAAAQDTRQDGLSEVA